VETTPDACSLCGGELRGETASGSDGAEFCSAGCKGVADSLETAPPEPPSEPAEGPDEPGDGGPEGSRLYLQVDGMHSPTCELFIESLGEEATGVHRVEASYVTETACIDYDPEETGEELLCEQFSAVGYDATSLRRDSDQRGHGSANEGHWEPDQSIDEMLGFRYVAGVVFGVFMLLPYFVVLYPTHIAATFGMKFGPFESVTGVQDTVLLLPLFSSVSGFVLFFTGLPLLRGAYVSLRTGTPNTDLLVAVTITSAYVSGVVALLIGRLDVYFDLTIVIAASVVAAIFYESLMKQRAVDQLTDLTVSQVKEARLRDAGGTETVPVEAVTAGDQVLVTEGERVPLDGTLVSGSCTVDEAVVTGESLPVVKHSGDAVVGGSVVTDGAAIVEVGAEATSSIDRLTRAVWELQSATHGLQRRVDRLARFIIPAVVGGALVAAVATAALGDGPALVFLAFTGGVFVLSPWGLGLSTPLSVATNIRDALAEGVVVFDETVFERIRETDVVVFDKTGTLTTGTMEVLETDLPPELLERTAELERRASHPAADAIAAAYAADGVSVQTDGGATTGDGSGGRDHPEAVSDFETYAMGVSGEIEGSTLLVGHPDLFEASGWTVPEDVEKRTRAARRGSRLPVVVGCDGEAAGIIVLGDEPRGEWNRTLDRLAERDINAVILTGDDETSADRFSHHPAVTDVFAGVPPAGKTATVQAIQQADSHVTMVGDGTNDAPALAKADLGIALGGGTALASDAADLAIVDDNLTAVETVFDLASAARRRVAQNTGLALLYNVALLPFALLGLMNPFIAMAGVVLTGGLVGLNSTRSLLD